MGFVAKALNFAEGLVNYVLERYSKEKYKATSSNYRLNRRAKTSGSIVDDSFRKYHPIVGVAVFSLQPLVEKELNQIDKVVYDLVPERFEPVKFLEFCSLATLEMAQDFFYKANFMIPDSTTLFIAHTLKKYYKNGSFVDGLDWGQDSWWCIYDAADSIVKFKQVILISKEFVPKALPPSTPDPVEELPNEHIPQYHQPSISFFPLEALWPQYYFNMHWQVRNEMEGTHLSMVW